MAHKFDFLKLEKLNSPERKKLLPADEILRKLGLRSGMKMAEIGCGSGFFSFPAAAIAGKEGFVWGVDINQEFLDYCNDRAKEDHVSNIAFLRGEESKIPLGEGAADVVLMALVLHELKDPKTYFKEIKRVVKQGGKIFVVEWQKKAMQEGPSFDERIGVDEINEMAAGIGMRVVSEQEINNMHYAAVIE